MVYDVEKEFNTLLHKIKADIPKDENGDYPNGFFEYYNTSVNTPDECDLAESLYNQLNFYYADVILTKTKQPISPEDERLGGDLLAFKFPQFAIPLAEECFNTLHEIHSMWTHLEKRVEPRLLDILEACLRYAWAIVGTTDNCYIINEENVFLFEKHLKAIYRSGLYAFDAFEMKSRPAPQVVKEASGVDEEMFKKCLEILGPRPKSGKRLGTYTIDGVGGKTMDDVIEHVIKLFGANCEPGGFKRRFYKWEKELLEQKKA